MTTTAASARSARACEGTRCPCDYGVSRAQAIRDLMDAAPSTYPTRARAAAMLAANNPTCARCQPRAKK